jgi:multiple sugar transport system substrate-binding protein
MRQGLLILCAAMLAVSAAVGCVKRKPTVTLKITGWGDVDETRILQKAIADFNKVHPEVAVEIVRVPFNEYITKILTQFAGNMAPDVMAVNAEQVPAFTERGILADLKPFLDKDPSFRSGYFYPEALAHYTVGGQVIAIPRDIAPINVVYYNKKKFDEAKLPYPRDSWTRAEFLETAKRLTVRDAAGKTTQWGFLDDWPIWEAWVLSSGGKVVDDPRKPKRCTLDSPAAIEGVQFRADLMYLHKVMPSPTGISAMGGLGNSDFFMNGSLAMFHSGIWKTPRFRQIKEFDWDVVRFPRGPGGPGFPMSAAGYGVLRTAKDPKLAYELVQFLAGEVGQRYMAATGLTQPALRTLAGSPAFLDGQDPKSKGFLVDCVKDGTFGVLDSRRDEWLSIIGADLDRIWSGDRKAAEVLPGVVARVNKKFFADR